MQQNANDIISKTVPRKPASQKAKLKALEKVFEAEIARAFAAGIANELPFQSRARIFEQLADEGLVERVTYKLSGWPPMTVSGYELTHAGRYLYCASCDDEPSGEVA